jgi:hypothetical protein
MGIFYKICLLIDKEMPLQKTSILSTIRFVLKRPLARRQAQLRPTELLLQENVSSYELFIIILSPSSVKEARRRDAQPVSRPRQSFRTRKRLYTLNTTRMETDGGGGHLDAYPVRTGRGGMYAA